MRSRLAARRRGLQRPILSSWTCFRAPPKSSRWIGSMSPASLELRSSTSVSASVRIPSLKGGNCHFSAICIERSPVPGSSHFPLALLTRRPLTSPTLVADFTYQADVLKEMDEGTGLTPEAVKELRRATDLALRATKHTARAVGRSMAASVAAERHLWHNLTEIREKEKVFLMDAPISQSGLFGEAVSAVVDKFRSAKTQSAALKQFMPRRARDFSTPSSSVSREQPLPRREPPSGGAQATRPSPTTVWGARGRSSSRQQPRKRVNLKRPNKPAASANPGRSWPSGRNEERRFTVTGRGQTAEAFLPAPNALSSLKSVTATLRGLVCRSSSPSVTVLLVCPGWPPDVSVCRAHGLLFVGAMCSHVDCLSPPILLLNHCFSGSSCVSLVTLVCLPI